MQLTKDYEIIIFFRYLILIVATIYAGINTLVPKSNSIIDVLTLKNIFSESDDAIEVQTPAGAVLKVGRALLSAVTAELILDVSEVPHKFMEHTDATVRDEDVKRLLDLLSQVRSCTVEVVEAIVVWRDAVSEQRMKLQLNNRYVLKQLFSSAYFLYE